MPFKRKLLKWHKLKERPISYSLRIIVHAFVCQSAREPISHKADEMEIKYDKDLLIEIQTRTVVTVLVWFFMNKSLCTILHWLEDLNNFQTLLDVLQMMWNQACLECLSSQYILLKWGTKLNFWQRYCNHILKKLLVLLIMTIYIS